VNRPLRGVRPRFNVQIAVVVVRISPGPSRWQHHIALIVDAVVVPAAVRGFPAKCGAVGDVSSCHDLAPMPERPP